MVDTMRTDCIMTYRGHIKNGTVVLDEGVELPEGAQVNIEVVNGEKVATAALPTDRPKTETTTSEDPKRPTIWDKLLELAGTVEGPPDWAENHDHYLYGTPKRK
jgi:hypothetical protein